MRQLCHSGALLILTAMWAASAPAQNVTNYPSVADPLLLLLREPAVLDDLQLDAQQRITLEQANEALDGPLLSSRNKPLPSQSEQLEQWLAETRRYLPSILTPRQVERIEQIRIRIRGYRALLDQSVAEHLQLTNLQRERVKGIFETLHQELTGLQERAAGGEPQEPLTQQAKEIQNTAQKRVIAVLTNHQRRQFAAMVGRSFDVSKLAQVRFKAPEFAVTDAWLNSPPLQMEDLRGKVVALHFWAYG